MRLKDCYVIRFKLVPNMQNTYYGKKNVIQDNETYLNCATILDKQTADDLAQSFIDATVISLEQAIRTDY